jgi:hypothetical protein
MNEPPLSSQHLLTDVHWFIEIEPDWLDDGTTRDRKRA